MHHQVKTIWLIILQGDNISMDRQLQNHQITISNIIKLLGNNESLAATYLSKCIYSVVVGNNDYINNYLMPQYYLTSHLYNPEQYATVLSQQFYQQLLVSKASFPFLLKWICIYLYIYIWQLISVTLLLMLDSVQARSKESSRFWTGPVRLYSIWTRYMRN